MFKVNPYRPGAGLMPAYIAGRDDDIDSIEEMFNALLQPVHYLLFKVLISNSILLAASNLKPSTPAFINSLI